MIENNVTSHVVYNKYDDGLEEWSVAFDQNGETKEYETYPTEVEAKERASYINCLYTDDWNEI